MKTVNLRKSIDFSSKSKVFVKTNGKNKLVQGHEFQTIELIPDMDLYATHLWTQSPKLNYAVIKDGQKLEIRPVLGKRLAFVIIIVFSICLVYVILTKNRWSFLPLIPFVLYILLYLTILKNKYLRIQKLPPM